MKLATTRTLLLLVIASSISAIDAMAQRNNREKSDQFWIGFRGGINLTQATPEEKFYVFSPTDGNSISNFDKTYDNFSRVGTQVGIIMSYEFIDNISVTLQPTYSAYRFDYATSFSWEDIENPDSRLDFSYTHEQSFSYLEIPLMFRYDFILGQSGQRSGNSANSNKKRGIEQGTWVAFAQAGGYYGRLLRADKTVTTRGVDQASGGVNELDVIEQSEGIDDLIIDSNVGVVGGLGIGYTLGNARISFEVNYKYGLNNITNEANRFTEDRLSTGVYDALDNIQLSNVEAFISFVIPVKYITSGRFKAL
ncbi:MAG: outer membrane beta-barrel protein [Bacteroidota bacterium]